MPRRERIYLDGAWQFFPQAEADKPLLVPVPAPWQAVHQLRHFPGPAQYQREFELAPEQLDQRVVILGFGAVDYLAEIWVNGDKAGEHEGGYLPFELDITSLVQPGQNTLQVTVSDPPELFAEIPHGKQSWYGQLSGIWQSVWLETRAPTHIQQAKITPHPDGLVEIALRLSKSLEPTDCIQASVFAPPDMLNPEGNVVAQAQQSTASFSLAIMHPQPWEIDNPALYRLRLILHNPDGQIVDEVEEVFGFRTIATRDGKLWLNGRPLYLRAALDQDYYPELICTPPSQEYIEAQFLQAKAMGLNCLRVHIKIADPRYYQAADRLGLLIWTELPNWILLSEETRHRAQQTLLGMVERDWNHPSIIIWTIINESWGVDLTNPDHRQWLRESYQALKALDPYRLVVDNSACWGNSHVESDLDDFHNYYAMPDHAAQWDDWVARFANRPWWSFAHAYPGHTAWRAFQHDPWTFPPQPHAPEVERRGDEPLIISEFGNWGLPDIEQLVAGYQGEPWWFETGLDWGEGVVYPHGVEQRFQQYALNRAFPNLRELSAASQRLQTAALKYEIERIRSHAALQGYVITEFTDVHWECNGLLDILRYPKSCFELMGQLNQDDLLIPTIQRTVYRSGEIVRLGVALSNYSTHLLHNCRLVWQLNGAPSCQGSITGFQPQHAGVTSIGQITFSAPSVSQITRQRLVMRLLNSGEQQVCQNYIDLDIFPPLSAPEQAARCAVFAPTLGPFLAQCGFSLTNTLSEADLAVVSVLTDELRQYLLDGGRVLWLAETNDSLQTCIGNTAIQPRRGSPWQGDWASSLGWLCQDLLFAGFPGDGLVDFACLGLTPEHVITGIAPRDFADQVHSGMFIGWLHRPVATVAERHIGRGTLLISTFRISPALVDNPLAQSMLLAMITKFPHSSNH